ncbi:MAG: SPFH domain-containing protein [Candidatus Poribacteria bacterium]|nr:SPFH domain-containing protein [Candidatus Poribacteria bacterium]
MIGFLIVFFALLILTLLVQLVTKMKIVGASELGVVAGKGKDGFTTLRGGRVFVFPLIHRFYKMDLRPQTTSVKVDSAIAAGIVPLTVVATVSFAVASSGSGSRYAIRRILTMTRQWDELSDIAKSIIEGHLRDSIATMTPEEVMTDKERLVQNMIRVCKVDLEGIGLEITSMNIADVDDHRLEGVEEPELYIALLKRIQSMNAETQSREAKASANAAAKEASESRRAEVTIRNLENERDNLLAQTRVKVASERQRSAIETQKAERDAEARIIGIKADIEAEARRIEMLRSKYEAEILTPAVAQQERMILDARARAATIKGRAQAEIDQMKRTIEILKEGDGSGLQAYLIENFEQFIEPFAETLSYFPIKKTAVISGMGGSRAPISAVHPHPVEEQKAKFFQDAMSAVAGSMVEPSPKPKPAASDEDAKR